MEIERLEWAIEATVRVMCGVRSRTHPYVFRNVDGVWIAEDAPGNKRPRKSEFMTVNHDPAEVVRIVQSSNVGWHFLCDNALPEADLEARSRAYKEHGYRKMATEWVYDHKLANVPDFRCRLKVKELVEEIPFTNVWKTLYPAKKWIPGTKLFGAIEGQRVRGCVYDCPVEDDTWVRDLYVEEDFRNQGVGKSLMSVLLRSAAAAGRRRAIVIGSKAGSRIYPQLGCELVGVMQIFSPVKR